MTRTGVGAVWHSLWACAHVESDGQLSVLKRTARRVPFKEAGKVTPVFVRFLTASGERGSKDTARAVRGFALKFYIDEGN